ncbi:MAG: GIY-YIG nuclease family protein [bacterium]|nr:GIY-YIG nuclease family protein [bacterium]
MIKVDLVSIPSLPGVYIFKKRKVIIYIGKAKDLKNRLRSYFYCSDQKSLEIVEKADDLEYIITNSDLEAQILESKLIYQYKPIYNIQYKYRNPLKYIGVIDKDGYPFFSVVSEWNVNTTEMFGPFIHSLNFKQLFNIVSALFGVRQCDYNFNNKRPDLCMYYYIGLCSGPCQGKISKDEYNKNFHRATEFIKLKQSFIQDLIDEYQKKIRSFSENHEFEKAIIYRNKMYTVKNYLSKILDSKMESYLYILFDDNLCVLGIFYPPTDMKILEVENFEDLTPAQILFNAILNIHSQRIFVQQEYYSELIHLIDEYVKLYHDETSDRIKKIQIQYKMDDNFNYLMSTCLQKVEYLKQNDIHIILKNLSMIMGVDIVYRIEVVDISHFYGEDVYGALVVFEKSNFSKSKYRIFKLYNNFDDLSNIYDLVIRRFKNISKDKSLEILPQLMVVDGGINQLLAAVRAFRDSDVFSNTKFISISKPDDKIYFYDYDNVKQMSLNQNIWNFIRRLRDEAHRFANSRRKKFSKNILK